VRLAQAKEVDAIDINAYGAIAKLSQSTPNS
jgi:hypothetical protein